MVSVYTSSEELNDVWESRKWEFNILLFERLALTELISKKAKSFGIKISNVPQYSPSAIAEFAVALSL